MNPADFEEVVHRLGEHVGILDREGNLVATRLRGEALGAKIAEVLGK